MFTSYCEHVLRKCRYRIPLAGTSYNLLEPFCLAQLFQYQVPVDALI